jgi:hypothetical protein
MLAVPCHHACEGSHPGPQAGSCTPGSR